MKDKINKIKDDAYYQYGFYIGFAIANSQNRCLRRTLI